MNWRLEAAAKHHRLQVNGRQRHTKFFFGDPRAQRQRPGDHGGFTGDIALGDQPVDHRYRRNHAAFGEQGHRALRVPQIWVADDFEVVFAAGERCKFEPGLAGEVFEITRRDHRDAMSSPAQLSAQP